MRNLKIVASRESRLSGDLPLSATAWDSTNNTVICAFGPTPTNPVIVLKRRIGLNSTEEEFETITSWDSPSPLPDLECDEILLLQHFSDTATSCVVLAGGDVVIVREAPLPEQEKIEIVGSVDAGICAAVWAPDEEILAIVTRVDTLVLMSRTFEPLNEATLSSEDLKVSKHVSVGWGQKETQFQGRRAKATRDPTVPEKVDQGEPSPYEDDAVSVSWREDGQYVAVNKVVANHRRLIRVFTREAVLDSASEPVDGMESALSWKPSGQLIAGVKRSETKMEVIFFERNGLRHGQFDLRVSKVEMDSWASRVSLAWNIDSSVLAVSFKDRIQFWTMGNYHYHLKQEIPLFTTVARLAFKWHPETPMRATFTDAKSLYDFTLLASVSRGSTIPPYDHGIVGVIDGRNLKLTPFKQAGVPPPMAFCNVQFEYSVTDCAFSRDGQKIAVLTTASLELCQWKTRTDNKGDFKFMPTVERRSVSFPPVTTEKGPTMILHITQIAIKDDEVFLLSPKQASKIGCCYKLKWSNETDAVWEQVGVPDASQNLVLDTRHDSLWATDPSENTTILLSDLELIKLSGSQSNSSIFSMPELCSDQANGSINGHIPEYHKVSFTSRGSLFVDDKVLVREVTSYILTSAHLMFTTSSHLLKFVHLTDSPSTMQVPPDTPELDERCRNIERGGKIVTVIPSTYALVLQMPRGNLETIYPRLLVLSGIRNHLKQQDYLAAFLACQTHQVDMNILHDFDPEMFLSHIPQFIEQLKKPGRVDEFLSKLKDEDVTKTLYRDTTAPQSNDTPPTKLVPGSKINKVADAFLAFFTSTPPPTYIRTTITAHVCKRPPGLPSALAQISTLLHPTSPSANAKEEADLAISHLFFLTPSPTLLFDAALASYNLQLTLLIAQNDSARDPGEYMPFLQSLQDLAPLRRQYTIDNHLKKYEKALTSLHEMKEHDELKAYVLRHALYHAAIDLYKYDQPNRETITRLYAEYLTSQKSQHAHAATLYESLGDYAAAYPLYALSHQWRESLTCATLSSPPLNPEQISTLAHSLCTSTIEHRDFRAAAAIQSDYLHNHTEAARLFCKGSYFSHALRLLALHSLPQEIPHVIDVGLTDKTGEILELLADFRSQLGAQVPRITELRKKKEEDPLAFYGGDASAAAGDDVDVADNISLAATDTSTAAGHSLFTRYNSSHSKFGGTAVSNVSRKTSKTKRREERKRARGKKGSVYEEEYLVASVGRLIERWNGLHEEVGRLLQGLVRRGMGEVAKEVGEGMDGVGRECALARGEVWGLEEKVHEVAQRDEGDGMGRPLGADGVFWDSLQEGGKNEAPEVKVWNGGEIIGLE